MKRALTVTLALAAALPLLADEPQQTTATTAPASQEQTVAPAPVDSPLVAAAKRAKRSDKRKATIVITHETLRQAGANAHVTTTAEQRPIVLPPSLNTPRPTPEMKASQEAESKRRVEAAKAEKEKKAGEVQQQRREATANADEQGDLYDEEEGDPSLVDHPEQNKPPQS